MRSQYLQSKDKPIEKSLNDCNRQFYRQIQMLLKASERKVCAYIEISTEPGSQVCCDVDCLELAQNLLEQTDQNTFCSSVERSMFLKDNGEQTLKSKNNVISLSAGLNADDNITATHLSNSTTGPAIVNFGWMKTGTTAFWYNLKRQGIKVANQHCSSRRTCASIIFENVKKGLTPLHGIFPHFQAIAQLDSLSHSTKKPVLKLPQYQFMSSLHIGIREFLAVMTTRNTEKWIRSIRNFNHIDSRLHAAFMQRQFLFPGLNLGHNITRELVEIKEWHENTVRWTMNRLEIKLIELNLDNPIDLVHNFSLILKYAKNLEVLPEISKYYPANVNKNLVNSTSS